MFAIIPRSSEFTWEDRVTTDCTTLATIAAHDYSKVMEKTIDIYKKTDAGWVIHCSVDPREEKVL